MAQQGPLGSSNPGRLVERVAGQKTHICVVCGAPIAVYGRLTPCLHSFCMACAAEMSACLICKGTISRIERIPTENGLHISAITLQSFKTAQDLAKHTQKVWTQIEPLITQQ